MLEKLASLFRWLWAVLHSGALSGVRRAGATTRPRHTRLLSVPLLIELDLFLNLFWR